MSESGDSADSDPSAVVRALQAITPGFIRRSFAIKFGLVLVVMGLSIGIIGLAATQTLADETESNAESEFQGVASQQADIIEEWLESNSQQVRLLSANPVWTGDEEAELEIELENQREGLAGDVVDLHVIDDRPDTGPVVAAGTDRDAGFQFQEGERQWIRSRAMAIQGLGLDEVFVADTYELGGERVVGFVSPTAVVDNRYLLVEVSVFDIQRSLRGANPERDVGFTQVVDVGSSGDGSAAGDDHQDAGSGTVVLDARGETGKLLETYATSDSALEPLQRATDLRGSDGDDAGVIGRMSADPEVLDEEYTAGYAPIENSDWVVVTHGPRSEVFGLVDALSQWGLIVTAFAVLLIGVTGSLLGYSTATSIDRLTRKTDDIREGTLDVDLHTTRVDNIGRLYGGFADMRDSLREQIEEAEQSREEAETARKEAEVARAEAEEMATYLQEKAEEYSEIMQQVGTGDLTQRMSRDGEEASMDRIAEDFNGMIEELEKTTGQLKSYVDEVEEAGAEVENSASTVREASEQVADSIQKISDDAYQQKERLEQLSDALTGVAGRIETIAAEHPDVGVDDSLADLRETADDIDDLVELSDETMVEAEQVAGAAQEQAAELNEVSERAHDLQQYAQPLRDILERFETEAEHEFVFSVGPTGGAASPGSVTQDTEET